VQGALRDQRLDLHAFDEPPSAAHSGLCRARSATGAWTCMPLMSPRVQRTRKMYRGAPDGPSRFGALGRSRSSRTSA